MSKTPIDFTSLEIGPGVFFKGDRGRYRVWVQSQDKEVMGWDYEEIQANPQAWFDSLKTVALSIQSGPSAALNFVEVLRKNLKPPLGSITCNICGEKFVAPKEHPYVFKETLNSKEFYDFQCSEFCHKQRRASIYEQEMGEEFLDMWKNKFYKE